MIRFFKTRKDVAVAIICAAAILACHKGSASSVVAIPAASPPQNPERSARVPASHVNPGAYPFQSAEKAAVEDFLRQHTDLRLATDADRQRKIRVLTEKILHGGFL